jgi:hypothetical protein
MYKYIVYCSVSAIIIIVAKYIYQNWLKITHYISDLKNQISLLQNKVKTLEGELEKRTISGGAKIPIVFRPIEKKSPKKTITILDNSIESSSSSASTPPLPANVPISSPKAPISSPKAPISSPKAPISSPKIINLIYEDNEETSEISKKSEKSSNSKSSSSRSKTIEATKASPKALSCDLLKDILSIEQKDNSIDFKELDRNSEEFHLKNELNNLDSRDLIELNESNTNTDTDIKIVKKPKKKSALPDAKLYNNGDKIKEGEIEYICVVGKRGGHSWKKI